MSSCQPPTPIELKLLGVPDSAVEVLSEGLECHDRQTKRAEYAQADLREYWIVDLSARGIEILRLRAQNQIVIPCEKSEALKMKAGDQLIVVVRGDKVIILERPKSFAAAISGIAQPYPPDYLKEERESWD